MSYQDEHGMRTIDVQKLIQLLNALPPDFRIAAIGVTGNLAVFHKEGNQTGYVDIAAETLESF